MKIRQCPCGKTPKKFFYETPLWDEYQRWAPECCGKWMFEFKVEPGLNREQREAVAFEAWNDMPRNKRSLK